MKMHFFNVGHRVYVRSDLSGVSEMIADCSTEITAAMIVEAVSLASEIHSVMKDVEFQTEERVSNESVH